MRERLPLLCLRAVVDALLLALPLLVSTAWAQAANAPSPEMEVLNPQGHGIPLAPYLSELVSADPRVRGSVMPRLSFPIRTALQPGHLPDDGIPVLEPRWLVQPIFLVGADARSLAWLEFNRERLADLRATGIVMQAADPAAFRAIQSVAPALSYAPAGGGWLEQQLLQAGVRSFPVFIDAQGRAWQRLGGVRGEPWTVGMPWRSRPQ